MRSERERSDVQRWERSARFWMRAYPRRWRVVRADEVLAVLMDLAAPGARRVGVLTAADLVKGGWATRWRGHPPLLPWLGYRVLDRRLPAGYREWAADDIQSPLGAARNPVSLVVLVGALSPWVQVYRDLSFAAPFVFVSVLASVTVWPARRLRLMERHVLSQPGERVRAGQLVAQSVPRQRVAALAVLPWLLGSLVALLLAAVVAALAAPNDYQSRGSSLEIWVVTSPVQELVTADRVVAWAVVLVSAGCAGLAAVVMRRRLRWASEHPVPQPARMVHGLQGLGRARIAAWTAAGLVLMVLEAVGALPLSTSLAVLALGPAALVVGLAFLRCARRLPTPGQVALADLWWVFRHGGTVPVDEPVAGLAPIPGPVPDGVVVPPRVLGGPRFPALPV